MTVQGDKSEVVRGDFHVVLVKPSHYDDDGYVIQWRWALIASNSLSCLYALALEAKHNRALGEDTDIKIDAYDECNTVVPIERIARRLKKAGGHGIVCLVGVQSNQFPRALDIARQFRQQDIQVAIGGFHVSGCIAMLPDMPADLNEALGLGITLYAGEAEGRRFGDLLRDAHQGELQAIYNYLGDLPDMKEQPTPFLPESMVRRYAGALACFDAGRGCPFTCSFCTIINVQGHKSRYRDADDIERLIRANATQGINRFFITDDNFARNKNWEAIFDRMIELAEREDLGVYFTIQVDTLCHKIPNFIDKAARAGCKKAFIGLENINPDNLKAAGKRQNRITEYRSMLHAWRDARVGTYCGYILGFPSDTPESIERDIEIIKRELPVDMLEFFILTPLPGSVDHRDLHTKGVWMDPDMNVYDLEHVTTGHENMSKETLQAVYRKAWDTYYSPEHIPVLIKRSVVSGIKPRRLIGLVFQFYAMLVFEKVHPLQGGFLRRKIRKQRRRGLPIEYPPLFYARRLYEMVTTYIPGFFYFLRLRRLEKRIRHDPASRDYHDAALARVTAEDVDKLDMFTATDAAKQAVNKTRIREAAILAAKQRGEETNSEVIREVS